MDSRWTELQKALIGLLAKIETIESIQKLKGENFNIFSILKMERLEVQTHSTFIFELINPNGTHEQGTKYLEIFLHEVLDINDFDLMNVKVKREDPTDEGRRIDFTIENNKYFIAIEMKIDAVDQPKQLLAYKKHSTNKQKEAKLYYLTLDGREANENSVKDKKQKLETDGYDRISFAFHIIRWIETSIEKSASLPIVRETLSQYANLIRKLTGNTSMEITKQIVEMINNPQIAKSATQMSQNIGYVWALREAKFWIDLHKKLEQDIDDKWELDFDEKIVAKDVFNLEEFAKKIYNLRLKNNSVISGIILTRQNIQMEIFQANSTRLRYCLSGGQGYINTLAESMNFQLEDQDKKTRYGDSKINVKFHCKNEASPTYELFDDNELEKIVHNVHKEVIEFIEKINSQLCSD